MGNNFSCPKCQFELGLDSGAAGQVIYCPQCRAKLLISAQSAVEVAPAGAAQAPPSPFPVAENAGRKENTTTPEVSGMAVASMVLGILSVAGGWFWGGVILPVLTLAFGHFSLDQIRRRSPVLTGKGFAVAGITLGYVGLLVAIVVGITMHRFFDEFDQAMKSIESMFGAPGGFPKRP